MIRAEGVFLALFIGALCFHGWGVSVGWSHANLPGNEFRQTQTAISAYFIQRDHDFSLAYPTPVLGKPWSVPFEFPLYQWTAVGVSNLTGWDLVPAGRMVSAVCFYFTLPAVWLLLRRIGVARPLRWLVLAVVVSCPLHIFYARAFLIEMMALLFGVWFLWAYVEGVERRHLGLIVLANVMGIGAGLVKVTTFMLYLMPALAWTLWWYGRLWRGPDGRNGKEWGRWTLWASLAVVLPFGATLGWLHYADHVKSLNPVGMDLMSSKMHAYNFGTWETRTSAETWTAHWKIQVTNIAGAAVLFATVLVGLIAWGRWTRWALAAALTFLAVQGLFPVLYAWHEYYFVANATLLMVAIGLVLVQLWESPVVHAGRAWVVCGVVVGFQISLYLNGLYATQLVGSSGGDVVTDTLNLVTTDDDVIVIAGEDWASMTPYYARRKAWMLRSKTERSWAQIEAAMDQLVGESIGALLLRGDQRNNRELADRVAARFGLETTASIRWDDVDLYLHPARHAQASARVGLITAWGASVAGSLSGKEKAPDGQTMFEDLPVNLREPFEVCEPRPVRFKLAHGISMTREDDTRFFGAHPDIQLWFQVAPGTRTATVDLKLSRDAYTGISLQDASDGVELQWVETSATGEDRLLFSHLLNPRDVPKHRGIQIITTRLEVVQGTGLELRITPGPQNSYSRDWASISRVLIE